MPNSLLAGMFLLSEDNLLVILHLQLILSETESSHTLTDLNLEEQTHFAIIFICSLLLLHQAFKGVPAQLS